MSRAMNVGKGGREKRRNVPENVTVLFTGYKSQDSSQRTVEDRGRQRTYVNFFGLRFDDGYLTCFVPC